MVSLRTKIIGFRKITREQRSIIVSSESMRIIRNDAVYLFHFLITQALR